MASDQRGWAVQCVSGAFLPAKTIVTAAGSTGNSFSLIHGPSSVRASKESTNSSRQPELAIAAQMSCNVAVVSSNPKASASAAVIAVGVDAMADASMLAHAIFARLA